MKEPRPDAVNALYEAFQEGAELFTLAAQEQRLHADLDTLATQTVHVLKSGRNVVPLRKRRIASQATHVTGELVGSFFDRARLPLRAVPLGFDPSSLTAIPNDFSYQIIFSRQLQALGKAGDILWAFTTSGNSANVLTAMETAKDIGVITVLFSSPDGGKARVMADYFLYTPESSTPRIQELHLLYSHSPL